MNRQVPGWFPEILPCWVCLKMGVHKFYTNCLHRKLQFDPENDDWPILKISGYPASSFKCSGWWSKMAFKLRNKRIRTAKSRRSLNHLVLKKSIGLGYPLAIKHGNEKYVIYRWFSICKKKHVKGHFPACQVWLPGTNFHCFNGAWLAHRRLRTKTAALQHLIWSALSTVKMYQLMWVKHWHTIPQSSPFL